MKGNNTILVILRVFAIMNKKLNLLIVWILLICGCANTNNTNPIEQRAAIVNSDNKKLPIINEQPVINSTKFSVMINFIGKVTLKKTNELTSIIHRQMQNGVTEFIINMNSSGGDSDAGVSVYQYLKQLPISVITYNTGSVQSAAALIYCSGQKRYSLPHSFFMLHGSSTTYAAGMSLVEIEALLKLGNIHKQSFVEIFRECSNISVTQLEKYFSSAELHYFTALEAKEMGLVQEIAAPVFAKNLMFYNITD